MKSLVKMLVALVLFFATMVAAAASLSVMNIGGVTSVFLDLRNLAVTVSTGAKTPVNIQCYHHLELRAPNMIVPLTYGPVDDVMVAENTGPSLSGATIWVVYTPNCNIPDNQLTLGLWSRFTYGTPFVVDPATHSLSYGTGVAPVTPVTPVTPVKPVVNPTGASLTGVAGASGVQITLAGVGGGTVVVEQYCEKTPCTDGQWIQKHPLTKNTAGDWIGTIPYVRGLARFEVLVDGYYQNHTRISLQGCALEASEDDGVSIAIVCRR